MQRTISSLRRYHPHTFKQSQYIPSHTSHLYLPCTCISTSTATSISTNLHRTFRTTSITHNQQTSSSTSTDTTTSTSTPTPETPTAELTMEEKMAAHRARVAAGRAKRHAELEAQAAAEAAGKPWPPEGTETGTEGTTTTATTETTTTEGATGESEKKEEVKPVKKEPFNLKKLWAREVQYFREHRIKYNLATMAEEEQQYQQEQAKIKQRLEEEEKKLLQGKRELKEGEEEEEEEQEAVSDGKFYAPMIAEAEETEWDRRLDRFTDMARTILSTPKRLIERRISSSDNPVLTKVRDIKTQVQDKVEETRENFETSQNPTIWKIRDLQDRVTGDAEKTAVMKEIGDGGGFDIVAFLIEMEEYFIPISLSWLYAGEFTKLRNVVEKQSEASAFLIKEKFRYDQRQLKHPDIVLQFSGLSDLDIVKSTMLNDEPYVVMTFRGKVTSSKTKVRSRKFIKELEGNTQNTGEDEEQQQNQKQTTTTDKTSQTTSQKATKTDAKATPATATRTETATETEAETSSSPESASVFDKISVKTDEKTLAYVLAVIPDRREGNPFGWKAVVLSSQLQKEIGR